MFQDPNKTTGSLGVLFKLMEGSGPEVTDAIYGYASFLNDKEIPEEIKKYSLSFLKEFGKIADKDSEERKAAIRLIPPLYQEFEKHKDENSFIRGLKVLNKLSDIIIELIKEGEMEKE